MSRRLRFIPLGGALVEVTCRTFQGRYLLKPSPAVNDTILGVLGRAQRKYPVDIHAFVFLSNHYHMLISVPDAHRMAKFMGYFNSNLARELGRLRGWDEKFWSRRYQAIVVSEEDLAHEDRMKYLLSQGVKEGLVAHPADWSGASTVDALLNRSSTLTGRWRNRTREFQSHISKGETRVYMNTERVHLSPLPCWSDRGPKWIAQRISELIEMVLEEQGDCAVGELPDPEPTQRPARVKRSAAPLFHCATREMRKLLYEAYLWFVATYRQACEELKAGNLEAAFPSGSFPPPRPFVPA